MDTEIKPRKPAGPKPKLVNPRTINVQLTDSHVELARDIGKGNISAGIRIALEKCK